MNIMPRAVTSALAALVLAGTLSACAGAQQAADAVAEGSASSSAEEAAAAQASVSHELEAKTFPFRLKRTEKTDAEDREMTLYFVDGGEIPYVSVAECLPLVGELYAGDEADPIEYDIDDFGVFFGDIDLVEEITGTDPKAFDQALGKLISLYLDDSHSGANGPSYLAGEDTADDLQMLMGSGSSAGMLVTASVTAKQAREKFYPEFPALDEEASPFLYEEVGDTAIVAFDQFVCKKEDYRADADLDDPQDTIELIAAAHKQITRENSPIKNVVLDLSCNGGGQADAAIFAIAWYMHPTAVSLRDTLTGAQSSCKYYADINLDGEFDSDDWLPEDVKLYCLISGNSFSCGNLVPAAFKGFPGITLIGRTSGGGSNVVLPATTAIGTVYQISGTTQIGVLKNGSFYGADTGIDPDFSVSDFDTLYDRKALVDYIHSLK